MSFLKKLFGGRTPLERVAEGERLLARREPGLARLELEAALAADALPAAEAERVRALLRTARTELARARLEEARSLLESGEPDEARERLELARSLAEGTDLETEVAALGAAIKVKPAARAGVAEDGGDEPAEADEGDKDGEVDGVAAEGGSPAEGDDQLSPLELALLAFPEAQAQRLLALAATDAALGEALACSREGDGARALERFAALREPAASDPLVLRERARAALAAARPADAAPLLERARTSLADDVAVLELLMEARVAIGDMAAAARLAEEILESGVPCDLGAAVHVLVEAGQGEAALVRVDAALDRDPDEPRLWELRAGLCESMGSAEGLAEADDQAIEAYRRTSARPAGQTAFPLASVRRVATALAAGERRPAEKRRLHELLRMLLAHDTEGAPRWRALLREVEG